MELEPHMHAAYRVALGLDIWQLGLPVDITLQLLDIESGKIPRNRRWPEVAQNLWDRFLDRVALEMYAGNDLAKLRLNPWVPTQIWRAAEQVRQGDAFEPRYEARDQGVIPYHEFPPPKRRWKPYVRKFAKTVEDDHH